MSVKEGSAKKWSVNRRSWHNVYCKLLPSGWFQWFDSASSVSPKRSFNVKTVVAYLAFGEMVKKVPGIPSSLTDADIPKAFAIPFEPHPGTRVSFFICDSPYELQSWLNAIMYVIYPNQQPTQSAIPSQPPNQTPMAAGGIGFDSLGPPPPYNMPPGSYPPAPSYQYNPVAPPQPPFAGYPSQVPSASSYPTQPPMGAYPTQPPMGAYPTQAPMAPGGSYAPGPGGQMPYAGQQFVNRNGQPYQVVYVDGKPRKKKMGLKNAAVGLAAGLTGGYLASRMFGGFGGGWGFGGGLGRWGSWSSFSSFSWSD